MNFISIDARHALAELDDPRAPIPIKRTVAADLVAALIDYLDDMDGDADLEGDGLDDGELDTADSEPSLGWNSMEAAFGCPPTFDPDREDEHDGAEPDPDGEFTLGWGEDESTVGVLSLGFGFGGENEVEIEHEGDDLDTKEAGEEEIRGELDWSEYDSGALIAGGGSGRL